MIYIFLSSINIINLLPLGKHGYTKLQTITDYVYMSISIFFHSVGSIIINCLSVIIEFSDWQGLLKKSFNRTNFVYNWYRWVIYFCESHQFCAYIKNFKKKTNFYFSTSLLWNGNMYINLSSLVCNCEL